MSERPVAIVRQAEVAVITLNRPSSRNAVNEAMAAAIIEALDVSRDARAIVVTGADPSFCAGMDLRDLGADSLKDVPKFLPALAQCPVPIIAAVNGPAVTAGLEIALSCDFIVASERATFADTHLRVGVYPGPVSIELPRRIGHARAREMLFANRFVDAATALRIGLVNHVVAHGRLLEFAVGLGTSIAENDPQMLTLLRAQLSESVGADVDRAREIHARHAGAAASLRTSSQLASRHAAVIERSRTERGRADVGEGSS